MKEVAKMRQGILRELKGMKAFFDQMERAVKARKEDVIYPSYVFMKTLAYHMNEGDLSKLMLELHHAILHRDYVEKHEDDLDTPSGAR